MRRDNRLREQLDHHQFHEPLVKVWPVAMRLLADHHLQLVGRDRAVVGDPEQSQWRVAGPQAATTLTPSGAAASTAAEPKSPTSAA